MKNLGLKTFLIAGCLTLTASAFAGNGTVGSATSQTLSARNMIVNQAASNLMVYIELGQLAADQSQTVKLSGQVNGETLECTGAGEYHKGTKILVAEVTCEDGQKASLLLSTNRMSVRSYKAKALSNADVTIKLKKMGSEKSSVAFDGAVDIKSLN